MTTSEIKQAEPVAWRINFGNGFHSAWIDGKPSEKVLNHWLKQGRKLDFAYTHPAPAVAVNEQDRLDAARYRWLRDNSVPPHNFYLSVPVEFDGVKYTPQEVDSYIDAAIAAAEAAKGCV